MLPEVRRKGHRKMTRGVIKLTDVGEDCTKSFLNLRGLFYSFVKEDRSL